MKIILLEVSTDLTNEELAAWIEEVLFIGKGEDKSVVTLNQKPHVQEVKELR